MIVIGTEIRLLQQEVASVRVEVVDQQRRWVKLI